MKLTSLLTPLLLPSFQVMLLSIRYLAAISLFLLTAVATSPAAEANSPNWRQNFARGVPNDLRRSGNDVREPQDWRRSKNDLRAPQDWRRSENNIRAPQDWRRSESTVRSPQDWRRSEYNLRAPQDWRQ